MRKAGCKGRRPFTLKTEKRLNFQIAAQYAVSGRTGKLYGQGHAHVRPCNGEIGPGDLNLVRMVDGASEVMAMEPVCTACIFQGFEPFVSHGVVLRCHQSLTDLYPFGIDELAANNFES